MSLRLSHEDVRVLRSIRICQPHRSGAQYVLIPAQYHEFFAPLLTVSIDGQDQHGATLEPIDPRSRVLKIARQHLGKPFACMARPMDAPTRFSCSTFTTFVYGHVGIHLPRYSASQSYVGERVETSSALPGHLLFYAGDYAPTDDDRAIAHVAIKSGAELRIHGSSKDKCVVERRFQERPVVMAMNPFPAGDHVLLTLPQVIHDMDTALDLVRFWQKQELGR